MKDRWLVSLAVVLAGAVIARNVQAAALYTAPELPRTYIDTTYPTQTGQTINVAAGDSAGLQSALDAANYGDTIVLQAGSTYTGNYLLRSKAGTGWIVIRTSTPDASLPAPGVRVLPADAPKLARIVNLRNTTDWAALSAFKAEAGAHHYRFTGLEITYDSQTQNGYSLIDLGNEATSLSEMPHDVVFDRNFIHGTSLTSFQRCLAFNGVSLAVIDSYVSDCHSSSFDSQAVAFWSSPGPIKVVNNYLEGSTENLLTGGAPSVVVGMVPEDIEIRHNHFRKPWAWTTSNWTVKNLFELKTGRRILIDGNVFENNWVKGQTGTAILMRSGPDGGCTWCATQDITFQNNIVKNSNKGISIVGPEGAQTTDRVLIKNNAWVNVGDPNGPNSGEFWIFEPFSGPHNVIFDHNTVYSGGTRSMMMIASPGGVTMPGFVFSNNVADGGDYPIFVDGFAGLIPSPYWGSAGLQTAAPGYVFAGNVIGMGTWDPTWFPSGNFYPTSRASVGLQSDYSLPPTSPYKGQATDGTDPGVDVAALNAATSGAMIPSPPTNTTLGLGAGWSIRVFPNPWRSDRHAGTAVSFDQLLPSTEIKIFTASGHLVKTLPISDSSVAWDLTNESGKKVGSGIYLFVAKDGAGNRARGKVAIIK